MAKNNFMDIFDKHYTNYIDELSVEMKNQIVKNIEDGKDFERKPFRVLKKSTRDERERKGYGREKPILIRTGCLKDSIRVVAGKADKTITISSTLSYAEDLSSGNHSGWWGNHAIKANMPPRRFIEEPKSLGQGSRRSQSILSKHNQFIEDEIISAMDSRLEEIGITGFKK